MPRTRTPKPLIPAPARTGFDINSRVMQQTAVIQLIDPLKPDRKLDAHITIASPDSPEARAAEEAFPITFVDGKLTTSKADFERAILERAIAVTLAWDLLDGATAIPCTPDEVRKLYTDPRWRWIAGQIRGQLLELAGFFQTPNDS